MVSFEHLLRRCVVELKVRQILMGSLSTIGVLGEDSQVSGTTQVLSLHITEVRQVLLVNHIIRMEMAYFELS